MNFKDLHINIKIRLFINFFQKLTQMTIFPFMTIYFSIHFGLAITGILMLFPVIAALIASFYGGYFADKIGRKKVLLIGEKYRFLTMLVMALFNSPWLFSPIITYIFYFINNILVGIITPANEAIIIDVSTAKNRKLIYSLNYWSLNLSIALGSIIGAIFYKNHLFTLLLLTALASVLSYYLIKIFILETAPNEIEKEIKKVSVAEIFLNYKEVLKDRIFTIYLIVGICTLGLEFQLTNFIAVKLSNDFGIQTLFGSNVLKLDGVTMLGFLRAENTLLVVLLGAFILKLTNNKSDKVTLYLGVVLFSGGFALLAMFNNVWFLVFATLLFTIGELLYVPIHQSLLADLIKDDMRSQYIAVNSLRVRGAMIVGSLGVTLGSLLPNWQMSLIYLLLGAVSIFLYTIIFSKLKQKTISLSGKSY